MGLAIISGCSADDSGVVAAANKATGGDDTSGAGGNNGTSGTDSTGSSGNNASTGASGNMGQGGMGQGGVGQGGMGQGGMGQGGMGQGGMAGGMAGAGGGAMMPVGEGLSDMGYPWKSSWWISGCQTKAGHDCITIPTCPTTGANFEDKGAVTKERFPIGGTPGTKYDVTFQINGISEGKFYSGGTPSLTANNLPANLNGSNLDTFHIGGTSNPSNYNVIKLTVLDSAGKELATNGHYYFNSFPQSTGAESHRTFHLSYSKTIEVIGGGFVEYLAEDSNCHAIDNCGDGDVSDTVCNAARGIPNEEANPLPPKGIDPVTHKPVDLASLNSVNGASKPWHSQIIHLTITKVVAK